ncbi:SPFH/Band 7/PHB domain protein [Candidatus Pacearchaeota archaeon]|nr:SPFH/Band 7/PHB domain protein [Candidatus Pacearchaeota archaeon]
MGIGMIFGGIAIGTFIFSGIRIVRPTHKLLIETLGKYTKTGEQGLNWIIPIIQTARKVNITEQMVDVPEQTVQTSDKLNTLVDAMVYYQVRDARASEYNVDDHRRQLTSLARTTLRAVMGNMSLTQCIQSRDKINQEVEKVLDKETDSYGVAVLRVEVQRIEPPQDVQEAMNNVVKAEQKKIASRDTAEALEIEADGMRRAEIKKAEGRRQASILEAEGESQAFDLINKSFTGNAQVLKKLEVTENSLKHNSKIILTEKGISPQLLIGELPLHAKK